MDSGSEILHSEEIKTQCHEELATASSQTETDAVAVVENSPSMNHDLALYNRTASEEEVFDS